MRINIIGAGAVGMLLASFLSERGFEVCLIARSNEQAQKINDHQLIRQNIDGTVQLFAVEAAMQVQRDAHFIIIAVKYGQLTQVLEQLKRTNVDTPLLFLQNGLSHFEEALQLSHHHIAFSSVQFGAQKMDAHHVSHRGVGALKIAVARGDEQLFQLFEQLSSTSLPVVYEQHAERMLLEKALLNCLINPLTAILQIKNGQLLENKEAFQLLQTLYNELIEAFPEFMHTVSIEKVRQLCMRTATNTSSMLADRLYGHKTEIDTIAGAVIERAKRTGKKLPVLQTLYYLVKAFEESGEKM